MKPAIKMGSLLLAVMMVFTAVFASGCSLEPEWSYKTSDKELAIGIYIYSLNSAFSEAKSYAEKLDDYDGAKDTWLDMEITDDDGNTEVARTWIKNKAQKTCLKYLAVEKAIKDQGATVDSATLASAKDQSKSYWEVGPYASYGYIQPMKDELEKYGVSFESFSYCTADYSVNYSTLFASLYDAGGSQAVADSELVKFVEDNYADYTYFSVPLYESTPDETTGETTSVAMSEDKIKALKDEINGYVSELNSGKSFDDVISKYMEANGLTENPAADNDKIEFKDDFSAGDEVKAAYEKLETGKADAVTVGEGTTATLYLVYKKDIKSDSSEYVTSNHASVLSKMKTDDFDAYIDELIEKLEYEKSSAVDKYDPKMFFVAEEPTTVAEESTEDINEESGSAE